MDDNFNNNSFDNGMNNQQNSQPDYSQQYNQQYSQPDYSQQNAQQYSQPDYAQQYNQQYSQNNYTQQNAQQYAQPDYSQQNYSQQYPTYVEQPEQKKGMAIASLVLSLVSVPCCCIAPIFSILGIIFGIISLVKKQGGNGMAIAGIIVSSVTLVLWGISVISGALDYNFNFDSPYDFYNYYYNY